VERNVTEHVVMLPAEFGETLAERGHPAHLERVPRRPSGLGRRARAGEDGGWSGPHNRGLDLAGEVVEWTVTMTWFGARW
jgi:hypothetical protein